MIIRTASDDDWDAIYPFFRAIVDEGRTYAFAEGLSSEEARPLWMAVPPGQTIAVLENDVVVASAKMGPNRPARGSHVATASFMVDPANQVRGAGTAMGRYVIDWARSSGYRSIQFNAVVETNDAAVHLWQKLGFSILTTVPKAFDHPEHGLVGLHVMYMEL